MVKLEDFTELAKKIELLSPKPGDVVVIRHNRAILEYEAFGFRQAFHAILPEGVTWLFVPDGISVENLDETEMRRAGWERTSP